jgi:hypothetical protein
MKHILITRNKPDSAGFDRCDYWRGRWMQFDHNGQVLHAMFPAIKDEMESSGGNVSITFSSCRAGAAFNNPNEASIPEGTNVIALAPVEDATGDRPTDSMRRWVTLIWNGPGEPVKGDSLCQKIVPDWIDNFFTQDQLDTWKLPRGAGKTEVWIRPGWNAAKMFPDLFPKPTDGTVPIVAATAIAPVAVSTVEVVDVEAVVKEPENLVPDVRPIPKTTGKFTVRTGFSPRSKWRFFGEDGYEVARNFATEAEAIKAMENYIEKNSSSLTQTT